MRLDEYFARGTGPVISFEVFPPKTDAANAALGRVLPELVALEPDFMTVTYGAMGSTRDRTLEIAASIRRDFAMECACHLTCVGSSRADIDRLIETIRAAGIENIVALRGDPPKGEAAFAPLVDGFAHANELVAHIRRSEARRGGPRFSIAVAGYPEKHIEAPDAATDLANLKRKVDAGADVVVTQLFYANADFFRFVDAARAAGVTQPIVPGLLPIVSTKQIRRITSMCGAKIPAAVQTELEAAGDDDARAEDVGVRQCVAQATELIERGAPGIHFYVLNKSSHMRRIMEQLEPRLRR